MPSTPKENLLRAIYHDSPLYVPYWSEGVARFLDHRGRRPPQNGTDEWGVMWAALPGDYNLGLQEPLGSYPCGHPARTAAELLDRPFPDPGLPSLFAGLLEGVDREQVLAIGRHPTGPLERFNALLGPERAMVALLEEPDASQSVIERIADYHVGIARGYLAAGAEAAWLADDYAGHTGPFISLRLWRRMVLPGLARIIGVYQRAGVPVFFHTCGQAAGFVPDLLAAGVTAFNLESGLCDLAALKAAFGRRIGFVGGISTQVMLHGPPEAVQQAALRAMLALGREGGLVLAPDQWLAFPPSNEAALEETARRCGRYPLGGDGTRQLSADCRAAAVAFDGFTR